MVVALKSRNFALKPRTNLAMFVRDLNLRKLSMIDLNSTGSAPLST
jgi:hypothetical protein